MLRNSQENYGLVAKTLHWIMSIGIICLLIVGFTMTDMEPSDQKWQFYLLHKAFGVLILCFAVIRLCWRLYDKVPPLEVDMSAAHKAIANFNIKLLYLFMFIMPISGIIMSLYSGRDINLFLFIIHSFETNLSLASFANKVHGVSAFMLVILVFLHISGALFNHFILKNRTLRKMI